MNTNDAFGTNTAEITTTGNVAYMTAGDAIPENVAYGQMPPGTDECYDYVICILPQLFVMNTEQLKVSCTTYLSYVLTMCKVYNN